MDRKLSSDRLREEIRKITKEPFDVLYDTVSLSETQLPTYELLARDGILALLLHSVIPAENIVPDKRIVRVWGVTTFPDENRAAAAQLYKKLAVWLEEGDIKVRRDILCRHGRRPTRPTRVCSPIASKYCQEG